MHNTLKSPSKRVCTRVLMMADARACLLWHRVCGTQAPQLSEDEVISFFQLATAGEDPDKVDMNLIENPLRKAGITIKRKPGTATMGDGIGTKDDLKMAGMALALFGKKEAAAAPASDDDIKYKFAGKWRKVGLASRATDIVRELEALSRAETIREGDEPVYDMTARRGDVLG